jgi:hypothetical protein
MTRTKLPGFQAAGMGRTVSVRYDSREARSASPGTRPAAAKAVVAYRSPRSHAGAWF